MIIIDAYNLQCSEAAERFFGAKPSIQQLCRSLSELIHDQIFLVLDGNKKPNEPQPDEFINIKLKYSGQRAEADDVILKLLDSMPGARGVEVVSNDKKVRRYAREARAKPIKCEDFIRNFSAKSRRKRIVRTADEPIEKTNGLAGSGAADTWLKELGLGEGAEPPPARRLPRGEAPGNKPTGNQTLPKPEDVNMDQIFRGL
ncbi:MAG: NYN domain-containing protein [Phycisphaerae bacterium]